MNSPHNQVGGVFHLEGRVPSTLAVEVYEPPPPYPHRRGLLPGGASLFYLGCDGILPFPDTQVGGVFWLERQVATSLAVAVYKAPPPTSRWEGSPTCRGKVPLHWLLWYWSSP